MNNKVNLFLVGAMKAGTTSLTKLFEQHQDIFVCPVKEPNFFIENLPSSLIDDEDYSDIKNFVEQLSANSKKHFAHIKTIDEYNSLFKFHNCEKYLADCSTIYLHSKEAAKKIKTYNPSAKIVILLRDPVKRAFSHYKLDLGKGRTDKTFEDAWRINKEKNNCWSYYNMSLYATSIKYYQQMFGKENVKILSLEKIISNKNEELELLGKFLEIDFKNIRFTSENESIKPVFPLLNKLMYKYNLKKIVRKITPPFFLQKSKNFFYTSENVILSSKTYNSLIQFFEEDIKETEELIGYPLNYLKPLQ